jgi:hypothetical protein
MKVCSDYIHPLDSDDLLKFDYAETLHLTCFLLYILISCHASRAN